MIPIFPEFKPLEWRDRAEFEIYTSWLAPHSDFNFVSIWSWTINETQKISILNGNLVLLYSDYLPGEYYLSFVGRNKISETTTELIKFSKENLGKSFLKYIPEEVVKDILDADLVVTVDKGNCDYICHVADFAESYKLTAKHGDMGQKCRMFLRLYPDNRTKFCSIIEANKDELRRLFQIWADNKNLNINDLMEYKAFERYLQLTEDKIKILTIYVDHKLIGFSTLEILNKGYATCDFMKFDSNYKNMFQISLWKICEYLQKEGISYLNLQADLGSANLKASKSKCNPQLFLQRYLVARKSDAGVLYDWK